MFMLFIKKMFMFNVFEGFSYYIINFVKKKLLYNKLENNHLTKLYIHQLFWGSCTGSFMRAGRQELQGSRKFVCGGRLAV